MNKKIAFVVVALVVLVATFCVSFAGMPLNRITPIVDVAPPLADLIIPSSWEGDLFVDLILAQDYAADLYDSSISLGFISPSFSIVAYVLAGDVWEQAPFNVYGFSIEAFQTSTSDYHVSCLIVWSDGNGYENVRDVALRFSLPADTVFSVMVDGTPLEESIPFLPSPVFDFMAFVPFEPPLLGETVINNIIDTLWGTVVSVGDSFGVGVNQMVGDLFFDLETGDLSAFSIVIICFFALCLLVTIVNWLFFRLTNIKKF